MANKSPIVNNYPLDRSYYYALNSENLPLGLSKAITEATAFTIKLDLNGTSLIKFYIGEEANVNNIGGFNLTVNFYEATGKIITGSTQTVAVPATTKNTNQYVDITGDSYIETADYCIISGTLPYSTVYTVTLFAKGIYETAIDDMTTILTTIDAGIDDINSAMATANANIKDVSSAVATMNSNLVSALYVDGETFALSADKTMAMGGIVNPDARIAATGEIIPPALDEIGQTRTADFDAINKTARISDTFPIWERQQWPIVASVVNATDGTYHYYIDMEGFNRLALFFDVGIGSGSAVFDVLGTVQNDGTTVASAITSYENISTEYLGGTKTITTAALTDFGAGDGDGIVNNFKYIDIKIVATATNTADWIIYSKQWFE